MWQRSAAQRAQWSVEVWPVRYFPGFACSVPSASVLVELVPESEESFRRYAGCGWTQRRNGMEGRRNVGNLRLWVLSGGQDEDDAALLRWENDGKGAISEPRAMLRSIRSGTDSKCRISVHLLSSAATNRLLPPNSDPLTQSSSTQRLYIPSTKNSPFSRSPSTTEPRRRFTAEL